MSKMYFVYLMHMYKKYFLKMNRIEYLTAYLWYRHNDLKALNLYKTKYINRKN